MSKLSAPTLSTPVFPPQAQTGRLVRLGGRKVLLLALAAVLAVAVCYGGARRVGYALSHEETDDAEIAGDISPVLPRVSGYVSRILVSDNQRVKAGQPLVELDGRELDLKVANAEAVVQGAQAALVRANAGLVNARSDLEVAEANAAVAGVKDAKAAADLRRDVALYRSKAISDQEWTDSRAAADIARAQHVAADRKIDAARSEQGILEAGIASAEAELRSRESELTYARLRRSYATVTAPIAGVVSGKTVEPGEFVQAGQTLLSISEDRDAWVVANFKETQLAGMRAGEPVDFTVDAYPGVAFRGRVDSIAGATGARFALLPPDNASGNFVKVTQRVPVKIVLDGPPPGGRVLRQGMSVDAAVQVGG
ncbi:MAG: HlyD family secretion protein [Opitutaceae bacterium]